jgi:hypothetical protein
MATLSIQCGLVAFLWVLCQAIETPKELCFQPHGMIGANFASLTHQIGRNSVFIYQLR